MNMVMMNSLLTELLHFSGEKEIVSQYNSIDFLQRKL